MILRISSFITVVIATIWGFQKNRLTKVKRFYYLNKNEVAF